MKANGSVSMAVLHTFDPDIISSGKVTFTVAAGGQVMNPALTGKVEFDNVNIAMDGIPNGLSNMNGTLVFNEDRLQVQHLTGTTGGGELKIGGSIRYRNGLFADLTATGEAVRVRLYGLSATANANLKLQGGSSSALLSGTILLTRFGVGADVDLAAFSGMGGGERTARSERSGEQDSTGCEGDERAAARFSELLCEAGGVGRPDGDGGLWLHRRFWGGSRSRTGARRLQGRSISCSEEISSLRIRCGSIRRSIWTRRRKWRTTRSRWVCMGPLRI